MADTTFHFEHEDDMLEITLLEDGTTAVRTTFPQSEEDFEEGAPEQDVAYSIGYLRGVQTTLTALAEQGVDLSDEPFQEAFAIAVENLVDDEEE